MRAPQQGCRFAARCEFATEHCRAEYPPTIQYDDGSAVACWLHVPQAEPEASAAADSPREEGR